MTKLPSLLAAALAAVSLGADAGGLLLPVVTYHVDRSVHRNEMPLGVGYEANNVFALGFRDSKWRPSWAAGYRYMPARHAGLIAFVMTRKDVHDYRPFPGVLPVFTTGGALSLEATIIPRLPDTRGPVLFAWLRKTL